MTGANFASLVRFYTRTNSTTFTDANLVLIANTVKDDFAKEITKADEDIFGVSATRDLIASTTSREYDLPSDLMKIKRVEAMFDGTNWVKLFEKDLTDFRRAIGNETAITSQFSNKEGEAFYELFRKSLWLYSGTIAAVTSGLKLWYIMYPEDLTTDDLSGSVDLSTDPDTTSAQIPRELHELWARRISITWKSTRDKPIPLTETERLFGDDFKSAMEAITNPNLDRSIEGKIPDDSHLQY